MTASELGEEIRKALINAYWVAGRHPNPGDVVDLANLGQVVIGTLDES